MPRSLIIENFINDLNVDFVDMLPQDRYDFCTNTALSWEFFINNITENIEDVLGYKYEEIGDHFGPWEDLCYNTNIPVEFFIRYARNFGLTMHAFLLRNTNIPLSFFETNFDKIEPRFVRPKALSNPNLTYEFCRRLVSEKDVAEKYLLFNYNTPLEVVERLNTDDNLFITLEGPFVIEDVANRCLSQLKESRDKALAHKFARAIVSNTALPISYFEEHFLDLYREKIIDPKSVLDGKRISFEFIQRILPMLDAVDVSSVLINPNITVAFAEEIRLRIEPQDFYLMVADNSGLPEIFFEDHWPEMLKLMKANARSFSFKLRFRLSGNPSLSIRFFTEHPESVDQTTVIGNKFTYQLTLEEQQTERDLIGNALRATNHKQEAPLPTLMLGVMAQEAEKLEDRRWHR